MGPCIVCFDESDSPKLLKKRGVKCDSIYFNPTILNINMTFSRVNSENYEQLALTHDMFLLKPFTDTVRYVFPVFDECLDNLKRLFSLIENELKEQPDWYWSCRSRSYFIEMIFPPRKTPQRHFIFEAHSPDRFIRVWISSIWEADISQLPQRIFDSKSVCGLNPHVGSNPTPSAREGLLF